jgi:hypothetical protein
MERNINNKESRKWKSKHLLLCFWISLTFIVAYSKNTTKQIYVDHFFLGWSKMLRIVFNIFHFSVGDILYLCAFGFCMFKFFRFVQQFFFIKKLDKWKYLAHTFFKNTQIFVWIYLIFLWSWGLNYYRPSVGEAFSVKPVLYSRQELIRLNEDLLHQLNQDSIRSPVNFNEMVAQSNLAYHQLLHADGKQKKNEYSVKASIYSPFIAYLGISGYYNPFTGEAQIDRNFPNAMKPFLVSHEMAHQWGYGKEDEANFMAYLSAETSNNKSLKYASNMQTFLYANRILFQTDSIMAKEVVRKLPYRVKQEIREMYNYYNERRSPIEPIFTWVYDVFLTRHQQPQGLVTYQEVISLVIDYNRKNRWKKN